MEWNGTLTDRDGTVIGKWVNGIRQLIMIFIRTCEKVHQFQYPSLEMMVE